MDSADLRHLYFALSAALEHHENPTVILAKTKKGYGMGSAGRDVKQNCHRFYYLKNHKNMLFW